MNPKDYRNLMTEFFEENLNIKPDFNQSKKIRKIFNIDPLFIEDWFSYDAFVTISLDNKEYQTLEKKFQKEIYNPPLIQKEDTSIFDHFQNNIITYKANILLINEFTGENLNDYFRHHFMRELGYLMHSYTCELPNEIKNKLDNQTIQDIESGPVLECLSQMSTKVKLAELKNEEISYLTDKNINKRIAEKRIDTFFNHTANSMDQFIIEAPNRAKEFYQKLVQAYPNPSELVEELIFEKAFVPN